MRVKKVNGIHIHYSEQGNPNKPPIVFSNSLGTDFRVWGKLLPLLGDEYRFILYDKRGHGLSECPPEPYTIEDHVGDLAMLLNELGISNAILCGLSVGGMIAQRLCTMHPGLTRALILSDTAHVIGSPQIWDDRIQTVRSRGISALEAPILERWFSDTFRSQKAEELAGWREMLVRTPTDGYIGTSMAIRNADLTDAAKNITVPTLCLVGSEDGSTPPKLVKTLAELIPNAQFKVIEGAGHLPCVEEPEQMAKLILNFIEEINGGK